MNLSVRTLPRLLRYVLPFAVLGVLALSAWSKQSSRLSAAAVFPTPGAAHDAFLTRPGLAYVQAYVRFGSALGDDVIMFVDQELIEGTTKPHWISGGDWMALVGVQRTGVIWIGGGSAETMQGKPSSNRKWELVHLGQRLEPDTWYRLRVVADFARRCFHSFNIQGGTIDRTVDISHNTLDYPNLMPFDRASMIYIVGAMRSASMMKEAGVPLVYIDDVEAGIVRPDGSRQAWFADSFEGQTKIGPQPPIAAKTIRLEHYKPGEWYLERPEALFRIEAQPFAHSGERVGVADVRLDD